MLAKKQPNVLYFCPRTANSVVFVVGRSQSILPVFYKITGHPHASEATLKNVGKQIASRKQNKSVWILFGIYLFCFRIPRLYTYWNHCSGIWASRHPKRLATCLFAEQLAQANNRENIKAEPWWRCKWRGSVPMPWRQHLSHTRYVLLCLTTDIRHV